MKARDLILSAVALAVMAAAPADARKKKKNEQPVPVRPAPILALASANAQAVNYFYERRKEAPIWFTAAGGTPAVTELLKVLRLAPIDGHRTGPEVAAQVEAYVLKAQGGDPLAIKTAERALSNAWVDYVQALERPAQGVLFGDPYLAPKPDHPDRILAKLSAAPSIADHLRKVSSINPIYGKLRQAALSTASSEGPDAAHKLLLNLERSRIIPGDGRFIIVNVPEARLYMYDGGQPVGSMKVVVGKPEYTTPQVVSTMHYAVLNPYWHVPEHLIRRMAPNIAGNPEGYMKSRGYEVISDWSEHPQVLPASSVDWKAVAAGTEKVILRQLPGGANSMGKMKFPFPNSEGIYLHDTPMKKYFDRSDRALSNGCIRVEDYSRLANWLFMGQPPSATSDEPEQHVQLPRGVPVYVTYLTLMPEGDQLVALDDPYRLDSRSTVSAAISIPNIIRAAAPAPEPASVAAAGGGESASE